jgi:hypothetical protein
MKDLYEILQKSDASVAEIDNVLHALEKNQHENQERIRDLESKYREASVKKLSGKKADIAKIKNDLEQARTDHEALNYAIDDLKKNKVQARRREIEMELDHLEIQGRELLATKPEIKQEFMELAGRAAGLWCIIDKHREPFTAGGNPLDETGGWKIPIGTPLTTKWSPDGEHRTDPAYLEWLKLIEIFKTAFVQANDGRQPIDKVLVDLNRIKKGLMDELSGLND